ncbi:hypothetical protein HPB51_020973 [Rhipicephalus microplus]|uniref:Uncharacterized protein n=1 Tax=Rhipicephalus microplus TaxID=6941 RepID=A0A9J6DX87_RHIMP|nr:hypothetical protein HPB51_020973 [Rhipicephalus microplus]
MGIVGPSFGFILAGYSLSYYVDISTDASALGLSSNSPAWIGAWWLGFLVAGIMGITLGLITVSLPKCLPGYEVVREEKKADQSGVTAVSMASSEFGLRLTDLPRAVRRLFTNIPFILLSLAVSFNRSFDFLQFRGERLTDDGVVCRAVPTRATTSQPTLLDPGHSR